jgi:hypothetical protein
MARRASLLPVLYRQMLGIGISLAENDWIGQDERTESITESKCKREAGASK